MAEAAVSAPRFSVIVTFRNSQWLDECVRSIQSQDFEDYECLLMDDASDDTKQSANAIASMDERFQVYYQPERKYALANAMDGIRFAKGDVIVWVGGDDQFSTQWALSRIAKAYDSDPQVDASYGSFREYPSMKKWDRLKLLAPGQEWWQSWQFSHVLTFRRSLALQSFEAEPDLYIDPRDGKPWKTAGDVALYGGAISRARRVGFIDDVLLYYRLHDGSDQRQDRAGQLRAEQMICGKLTQIMEGKR